VNELAGQWRLLPRGQTMELVFDRAAFAQMV
jgi:hypothetical protein